ncbi:hypothetical protein GCM10023091_06030 [Ravibacter arvi]|uniref:CRISPR-associated endoribonuclease Cas2 n=1 Tax=Ravibacter arvi TaxID=2051041 RepID=A0ABP8LR80_9BACT
MPYFIAVYDVDQKRGGKMLKLFRRYLTWIQNSVFEGELTHAQFKSLQLEAEKLMQEGDGVVFTKCGMNVTRNGWRWGRRKDNVHVFCKLSNAKVVA